VKFKTRKVKEELKLQASKTKSEKLKLSQNDGLEVKR
jgi:hypothetical protein